MPGAIGPNPGQVGRAVPAPPASGVTGTINVTLGAVISAASGTVTTPPVTGTIAVTLGPVVAAASGTFGNYILADDFPGTSISSSNWEVYDRLGDQVNNEVNAVIPANVRVSSGTLKIDSKFEDVVAGDTTTSAPNPRTVHYTSGQIAQKGAPFLYGSVQVRAKICANGTGTWPCIWMLGHAWQRSQPFTANTPEHNWPNGAWWEADIAEFMQGHRTLQNCALHFVTANRGGSGEKSIPFAADSRFMVYRLDWTATSMTWYVDAEDGNGWVQLLQITGTAGTDIPNTPGYLIIHTAIGGAAAETPVSGTFPVTMEVDYARITLDATSPDNGTIDVTIPQVTSSISGSASAPPSGTIAATLGPVTSSISGTATPPAFTGTIGATVGAVTPAISATFTPQPVSGSIAATVAAVTSSISGTSTPPPVTGTVASTLGAVTSLASGTATPPPITGTIATTLTAVTPSISGAHTPPGVAGTIAVTLGAVTSSASGTYTPQPVTGTIAVSMPAVTCSASGTVTLAGVAGNIAVTLSPVTSSITATSTPPPVSGTITGILSPVSAALSGAFTGSVTSPVYTGRLTTSRVDISRTTGKVDQPRTSEAVL
jgi:beta-glucanase (GH16 family)